MKKLINRHLSVKHRLNYCTERQFSLACKRWKICSEKPFTTTTARLQSFGRLQSDPCFSSIKTSTMTTSSNSICRERDAPWSTDSILADGLDDAAYGRADTDPMKALRFVQDQNGGLAGAKSFKRPLGLVAESCCPLA
jgi:hypothetical protein